MKKYKYTVLDTSESIYANSGDEFTAEWMKTHTAMPEGTIRVTNTATGDSNDLVPFKFN